MDFLFFDKSKIIELQNKINLHFKADCLICISWSSECTIREKSLCQVNKDFTEINAMFDSLLEIDRTKSKPKSVFINIYMKPILKKDYKKYLTIFEDEGDSYE